MTTRTVPRYTHAPREVAHALSLFFAVRGAIRTKLGRGKRLNPSTWLRTETMKFIADHDAPSMKDVAQYLSITAPSATSLVQGLVRSGFVVSRTDAHDRRALKLVLTRRGTTELKKSITRGIKLLSGLFASLSEKELATFVETLERIKGKDIFK